MKLALTTLSAGILLAGYGNSVRNLDILGLGLTIMLVWLVIAMVAGFIAIGKDMNMEK